MAITFTAGTSVESTGSVTSTTVTLPAGLAAGDYTIIVASLNASSGVITTPAGWTNILASTNSVNGSTSDALAIFYRKWVSGDTNPAITTSNGRFAATPIRVQGADATTFVDVAATVTQAAAGATTLTAPTITPTSGWLVCVFNGRNQTNGVFLTPFTGLSGTMTAIAEASGKATAQTNAGHLVAFEAVTPSSATGTRQANPAVATTGAMGVSFSLKEAAAGGGAQTVSPAGFGTGETFGTPVASNILVTLPGGVPTAETLGSPGVSTTVTAQPAGITSGQAMGAPTIGTALPASPASVASDEAFGAPVTTTTLTASPSGIASAQAFGTPTRTGNLTATPAGVASAQAFGAPSIASTQFVSASGIASAQAMGTPSVAMPVTASPAGIPTAEAFGVPRAASSKTYSPDGIPSAESFGAPTLAATLAVAPPGIAGAAAFGSPSVTVVDLNKTLSPAGIPSAGAFGAPNVIGNRVVGPSGIASLESFGTPRQTNVLVALPANLPSRGTTFGSPAINTSLTAGPLGIATQEAVGQPVLIKVALHVGPAGIVSLEAFGAPRATGGSAATPYEMAGAMLSRRYSGRLGVPENTAIKPNRWEGTLG